ncbi:MAG: hypothetical protein HYT76_05460 [Deltaproteobacteria bacterium]|nr:hypothetical protein [Deltaproteobacteria bacterium]
MDEFFQIEGPDATAYLQRMVTNDILSMSVGEARHNALLDRKGMVLSLFCLVRIKEQSYLGIGNQLAVTRAQEVLKKFKIMEKVTITDVTTEWRLFQWVGLSSGGWLGSGARPRATGEHGWAESETGPAAKCYHWQDNFYNQPIWNLLYPVGAYGDTPLPQDLSPLSQTAFNLIRMESGIPEYGVDIDETHILLEANLSHTYKRNKGCYPGQEVVERILAYGQGRTPKKLCSLYLEGQHSIPAKAEILDQNGSKVGETTSALYNPLDQKTIVMGYLDQKQISSQRPFQIGDNVLRLLESN